MVCFRPTNFILKDERWVGQSFAEKVNKSFQEIKDDHHVSCFGIAKEPNHDQKMALSCLHKTEYGNSSSIFNLIR